jgi:hypothetical protein
MPYKGFGQAVFRFRLDRILSLTATTKNLMVNNYTARAEKILLKIFS